MLDICMSCRAQVGFCLLQKRLQTCTMEVTTWNLWVLLWCFCCYCFPGSFYPFSTPSAQQYLGWLVFKDLLIRFKQQNKKRIPEKKEYTLPASEKYCEYHLVLFFTDIKARENAICSSLWWFKISTVRNRSTRTHCPLQAPAKRKKKKIRYPAEKELAFEQPDVTWHCSFERDWGYFLAEEGTPWGFKGVVPSRKAVLTMAIPLQDTFVKHFNHCWQL